MSGTPACRDGCHRYRPVEGLFELLTVAAVVRRIVTAMLAPARAGLPVDQRLTPLGGPPFGKRQNVAQIPRSGSQGTEAFWPGARFVLSL